ncbi:hypothetical protein [Streptomyces sp. NBC_01006]|uniref:hypothetical protein n=1 Tax=Streptomyces sp. NBC_01006 TaxID=2903716 RepID=UPI00386DB34E|nr:hypothetical protein OG509_11915 [Streptomyces sp. NBC_01006]
MNNMKRALAAVGLAGAALSFGGAAQADGGGWAIQQAQSNDNRGGRGAVQEEATTIDNDTAHQVDQAGVVSDALEKLGLQ